MNYRKSVLTGALGRRHADEGGALDYGAQVSTCPLTNNARFCLRLVHLLPPNYRTSPAYAVRYSRYWP